MFSRLQYYIINQCVVVQVRVSLEASRIVKCILRVSFSEKPRLEIVD